MGAPAGEGGGGVERWRRWCCWLGCLRASRRLLPVLLSALLAGMTGGLRLTPALISPALAQAPVGNPATGAGWQTAIDAGKVDLGKIDLDKLDTGKPDVGEERKPKSPTSRRARMAPAEQGIKATSAELRVDGDRTLFYLQLTGAAGVQVYTLASPHRVVIDLADVKFQLAATAGRQGQGAVASFRYGLMAAGQSRIMLDLARPMRVETAELKVAHSSAQGGAQRLEVRLAPTEEATFVREASQPLPDKPQAVALDQPHEDAAPRAGAGKTRTRPVIVIDPGHGGVDPGAIGTTDVSEKALVLAVAKQVRALLPTHRYAVVMTRSTDVYVGLDARLEMSRRSEADLFVSIHADAIDGRFAQSVRGATIYTLSESASDAQAQRLAEKENAADTVAGLASVPVAERDHVKGILIDLMKRETSNFSSEFSRLLVGRLGQSLSLAKEPQRSAAFKVLKQTQSPSVLIELGYMTNVDDERVMRTPEWQRKVAQSIAAAIETYFAKRTAERP